MSAPTFEGYANPDGSIGVRNHLLVLSATGLTGPTARRIGQAIRAAVVVTMPYGSDMLGEDRAVNRRALEGFGRRSNVGAALVTGADPPRRSACRRGRGELRAAAPVGGLTSAS